MKRLLLLVLCVGMLSLFTAVAAADTVTYNGGVFGLSLTGQSGNTYNIEYTADFTNWTGGNLFIDAVNFQLGGQTPSTLPTLDSTNAAGNWAVSENNVTANGCTGGASSFVCAITDKYWLNPTSGTYFWDFTVSYANSADLTEAPIRALFVNSDGKQSGLLSMNTDVTPKPMPEPSSFLMVGSGLLGAFGFMRQRFGR